MTNEQSLIWLNNFKRLLEKSKEDIQKKLPMEIGKHTKGPFGKYFFFPQLESLDEIIENLEKDIQILNDSLGGSK